MRCFFGCMLVVDTPLSSIGTCSGEFGYIIAVINVIDIGKGMVLVGSGQAEFITRYRAIVFKPFKGEVVDAVVNNVNKVC